MTSVTQKKVWGIDSATMSASTVNGSSSDTAKHGLDTHAPLHIPESQRLRNHKSLATAIATQKNHCDSENALWSQLFGLGNCQSCVVFIVFQKCHMGLETPQNTLRLQGCDSESQRFFWPNAIFVIATLQFYCDFCRESLRLRSCDCQSLAICDCDCVGH